MMDESRQPLKPSKKTKKGSGDQKQVEELTNDLKRIQAEFINFKRRSEQDRLKAVVIGREQAVEKLLPILDNLDRALAHEPDDIKEHPWVKGVSAIVKQLESQLSEIGLKKIGLIGDEFDPELHEAVSMVDSEGEKDVIVAVAQVGYMLDGRVIRHAVVQVGRR